jgi:tRNA pseudouridine38-40 synthase
VHWFEVDERKNEVTLRVCADGFLYNMARAMAGTLLYVSEGKIAPREIPGLLKMRDRRRMGPTVPPWGLYLNRVWYDGEVGRMLESDFFDKLDR